VRDLGIPIAGINTGRLGFLATIQKEEIKDTINLILDKKFYISPRTIVTIDTVPPSDEFGVLNFAMNEIEKHDFYDHGAHEP